MEELKANLVEEPPDEPKRHDISETKLRFVVLGLASFLCFGCLYVYDNPMALAKELMERLDMNTTEYNMMYSIYSFPNIILPLIGGYLVDTLGLRRCISIFSVLVCIGQASFAIGVGLCSYWVAILGRGLFGIGSESLLCKIYVVVQVGVVTKWFLNKELGMALAMNISIYDLGSVFNQWVEPILNVYTGSIDFGLWFGFLLCVCSMLCGVALNCLDARRDKVLGIADEKNENHEGVQMSDIARFSKKFWLVVIVSMILYICIQSFYNIASTFYQDRFQFTATETGLIFSITYFTASILSPLIGIYVDTVGKRTYFILLANVLIMGAHLSYLLFEDCYQCMYSLYPLLMLTVAYSLYSAVVWAFIPYVVRPRVVVTAFGIATSLLNTGLAIAPMLVGLIHDALKSYTLVSAFFVTLGALGVSLAFVLHAVIKSEGDALNKPKLDEESDSESTIIEITPESELSLVGFKLIQDKVEQADWTGF